MGYGLKTCGKVADIAWDASAHSVTPEPSQMAENTLRDADITAADSSQEQATPADLAALAVEAPMTNGSVAAMYSSKTMGVHLDLQQMVLAFNQQVMAAQSGDIKQSEAMLLSQAITLNAIFAEMARRAALNLATNLNASEAYMRMALRAQNQSRATLDTLAAIGSPSVVIAKQANISAGPQQVNNLIADACSSEMQIQPNQLSGAMHELRQNP